MVYGSILLRLDSVSSLVLEAASVVAIEAEVSAPAFSSSLASMEISSMALASCLHFLLLVSHRF